MEVNSSSFQNTSSVTHTSSASSECVRLTHGAPFRFVFSTGSSFFSLIPESNNTFDETDVLRLQFYELISNRVKYIDTLKTLGNDWINGNCTSPDLIATELAKKILWLVFTLVDQSKYKQIPNLIMGPIAVGGITLELNFSLERTIYLSIYNNGEIDLEYSIQGNYFEVESDFDTINKSFVDTYRNIESEHV